ncbi:MAG TPA: HslU--HslV peptidase ATPase subunit, partial [Polymorphobacter sp.]|nr:HslU--HslV peptidase ATPase subunit [Polymorphobacter sp.]
SLPKDAVQAQLEASLIRQYTTLLGTEGVTLDVAADGITAIARTAFEVNERDENIGARRLQTVMEKLLETVSFDASERRGETVTIDAAYVEAQLGGIARNADLSKFIL